MANPDKAGGEPGHSNQIVPDWAADSVWYQVFVSRFCNGSRENDRPGTLPWTHDWAKLLPGEGPPLRDHLLFRRYGGDLPGLWGKLPYLCDLGVNTLYLNPVFQADSEHKYDTADHRHVDDSFGIADSRLRLTGETEAASTWQWSDSDRLFLDFLGDAHRQGFRVVLDGVFNHVGMQFWAWRDVRTKGRQSRYADWFDVTDWGPPLRWRAWEGPDGQLPNFKRTGDGLHPEVETYLFAIARRWMDPDGDGDPSDGIDGWRLDSAERVPHGFWRRFHRVVRAINPNAIVVGEIWTDATPWLGGGEFHAVTNYEFAGPALRFLAQDTRYSTATKFVEELAAVRSRHPWQVTLAMINLIGSHDTERAVSMLTDPQRHRFRSGGGPDAIPKRDTLKPDEDAFRRLQLAATLQFTYPGVPLIYYGDELGMYGGGDPFCRSPVWWPETGPPGIRDDVRTLYRSLAHLRRRRPELRRGRFRLILADDARRLVVFSRRYGSSETIVLLNCDTRPHRVAVNVGTAGSLTGVKPLFTSGQGSPAGVSQGDSIVRGANRANGIVQTTCADLSAALLLVSH